MFHFFPFQEADIKDQDIQITPEHTEESETDHSHAHRKAQKRPEKTLSLHLRLILSMETAYNNKKKLKKINKNNNKTP